MINYSIVKRSVNANLIEINQAKSRINQAKKEGKTPQPADLALVKTEKQNAFAVAQYTGVMNIDKFSRHISSHGSVYSRADIAAILYLTVDCMREQLLEGKKIRLGDLGDSGGDAARSNAHTEPTPSPPAPPRWWAWVAGLLAVAASLGVFALYMQPEFLISLADRLWSCF